jgi:4-diphosphocytidyl-2-C-methyl-D-erythritol kinase
LRADGKHEVLTVLQRVGLHDDVELARADGLVVEGFAGDTLVRAALLELAEATGVAPGWAVRIEKRIPVASGLGGGSSDAAAALTLANGSLERPLPPRELHRLAARVGADVPFFLHSGPQLGSADGTELAPLDLPGDYAVLLALPAGASKPSTAEVYRRFDDRGGADGFERRCEALAVALAGVQRAHDLAALPFNDLVSSPLAPALSDFGAFRADVSGAGPVVYGLFHSAGEAEHAATKLRGRARTWLVDPVAGG